jgi:hypothetical protein
VALIIVSSLLIVAFGLLSWQFFSRMRILRAAARVAEGSAPVIVSADRYRPMLRLLSDDDLQFVARNSSLRRTLRSRRRELFRSYLRCLTRDYACLLESVRVVMVRSGVDRPDLARALAKNRILFALAICKVEMRLSLHALGVGRVDVSGLVDALEALRGQVNVFSSAPVTAH